MSAVTADLPEPGAAKQIGDGIWWARLALPFRLNHVNVWILDDGDGWTVMDCGANTPETEEAWHSIERNLLQSKPVNRLIATHGHTDHVGYAGPFVQRHGCSFHAAIAEWLSCSLQFHRAASGSEATDSDFFTLHGCRPGEIGSFNEDRERVRRYLAQPPTSFTRISAGDSLQAAGADWRILIHGGHAPEHTAFHCVARKILIAGDQVLPTISPVIGVFPSEPNADPLGEYLDSLDSLAGLPDDVIVLPSHGLPFTGLHARLESLRTHHRERLARLCEAATEPRTALDLARVLFARAINEGQGRLALAETLAHLNYLENRGELRTTIADGQKFFSARIPRP